MTDRRIYTGLDPLSDGALYALLKHENGDALPTEARRELRSKAYINDKNILTAEARVQRLRLTKVYE